MQTNDFVNYRITDNTVSEFPKLVFRKVGYVVRKIGTYIKGCEIYITNYNISATRYVKYYLLRTTYVSYHDYNCI
jgi:hypothetical protein